MGDSEQGIPRVIEDYVMAEESNVNVTAEDLMGKDDVKNDLSVGSPNGGHRLTIEDDRLGRPNLQHPRSRDPEVQ